MKSRFFTLAILLTLLFGFLLGNVAPSRVIAESGVGKDVFKIVVSLYGITDSTKDIITIANVGDQTKVKLHPAGNSTSDKVSYVFSFPGRPSRFHGWKDAARSPDGYGQPRNLCKCSHK